MTDLVVKINQVAALREHGDQRTPDPVAAAVIAELAGANGIVVQIRQDHRFIQDRDVRILRKTVQTRLIFEMTPSSEMIGVALDIKPDRVVLVPERTEEKTDEGGMDLVVHKSVVTETIDTLRNSAIPVAVFIDPVPEQLKIAHQCNADMILLNTGPYSETAKTNRGSQTYSKLIDCIKLAPRLRMTVGVGRGLDYQTIKAFNAQTEISEFTIGHSIVARSILVGMENAVKEMLNLIQAR